MDNDTANPAMNEFPIIPVDRSRSQSVEPLGSKPKFWFRDGERRLLFKAEDRGTGEDGSCCLSFMRVDRATSR